MFKTALNGLNAPTIAHTILRFRWYGIAGTLLATLFFAWQMQFVVLDGSIERIMLKNDEARLFNAKANELFGGDEIITVVVRQVDGVWNEATLRGIQRLSEQLAAVDGVSEVYSLTNAQIVERKLAIRSLTLMERLERGIPMAKLRSLAGSDPFVREHLVSADGTHIAVNARLVPLEGRRLGFKTKLTSDIRRVVADNYETSNYWIAGWPVIQSDLTVFMERDLLVLMPGVAVVVMLLFALGFRRLSGVILPVTAIGIAQLWTVGGVAATGASLSIVTYSLPIIIIAIGSTYCIHVIAHIFRELDCQDDRISAVKTALSATGPSILLSGCTTMIGFAALKLNRLEAIDEFGTFAIWGIGVSVFMALVLLPCLAAVVPIRRSRIGRVDDGSTSNGWSRFLASVLSHRRAVWVTTAIVFGVSLHGVTKIRVETAPADWFPEQSDIRRSVNYANQEMGGITPYNIVIDSGKTGGVFEPELLRRMVQLQRWLEQQDEVTATGSIVDPIMIVDRASRRRAKRLRIPGDRARVEQVMDIIRSHEATGLDALVTADGRYANVIVRSTILSSEVGVEFADRVNQFLDGRFDEETSAEITGTGYLTFRTNIEFTNGLATSLGVGVGFISLVMIALLRSWKLGLLAMVPNLVPLLINYAILGLGDLTLNAATSITGCIAIGIAVDDTIHFLVAFREGMKRKNDRRAAVQFALETVGRPMLITTLALCAGFSVLLFSNFLPVVSLGLLVALTMVACFACDTLLLPVLLTVEPRHVQPAERGATSLPVFDHGEVRVRQAELPAATHFHELRRSCLELTESRSDVMR